MFAVAPSPPARPPVRVAPLAAAYHSIRVADLLP